MKFLQLATALLLPATAWAARKSGSGDVFRDYFSKQVAAAAPLKLDDKSYAKITAAPRNHTVGVYLTATEARFGCQLCREFASEWELLGKSWTKGDKSGEGRLLLGTLDFKDGQETFKSLMVQTAPLFLLFHPTVGPGARLDSQPERFDFSTGVSSADILRDWIAKHLPEDVPKPPISRPLDYFKIVTVTTAFLGVVTFATVAWPYISPILQNRNLWAAGSLIAILLFTSGHMYNHIRHVPYVAGDGKGGISYFAGGFQNQYGLETQIVAAIYGVLAFSTIALALKVPRIVDPGTQSTMVFIWTIVMFGMYSFLLSTFRVKNGGYPFFLPPF